MSHSTKNYHFIAPLEFLHLEIGKETSVPIMPGLFFRTDPKAILDRFGKGFVPIIGTLEHETLLRTKVVAYGECPEDSMQGIHLKEFIKVMFLWLRPILRSLWLIKDHNINVGNSFSILGLGTPKMMVSSNYMADRFLRVGGPMEPTTFSADELSEGVRVHIRLESYLHTKKSRDIDFMMDKTFSRIGRAIQFVQAARISKNEAFRIAHYCSAFETLFSTESTELSHRLSERVACFAAVAVNDRRAIYRKMKRAYNVRSKVTHGDVLSPKQVEELPLIAGDCDTILRHCLKMIILDDHYTTVFDSKNDVLEEFFFQLLFPDASQVA